MDYIPHAIGRSPVRFMEQLRWHMRQNGLAYATERTYVDWVKRYIFFHDKRHPKNLGSRDIEQFLGHLSVNINCSPNTQRVALKRACIPV